MSIVRTTGEVLSHDFVNEPTHAFSHHFLQGSLDRGNRSRNAGRRQRRGAPLPRAAGWPAERHGLSHPREVVQDGKSDHWGAGRYRRARPRRNEEGS